MEWLLDPQIAYLLLLVGMAGLFFEVTTPGAVFPGVVGVFCLLLALFAFSKLPTNGFGLLLLVLGVLFFLLEIHVTSYGLLSLAGLGSLFWGSLLLFEGPLRLHLSIILPTIIGVSLFLGLVAWLVAKAQLRRSLCGPDALVGQDAVVRSWSEGRGKVFVRGEIWDAVCVSEDRIEPGQPVRILAVDGLVLQVTAS